MKIKNALVKINKCFLDKNIKWGLGASALLFRYGIINGEPHDIDIIVAREDVNLAIEILRALGKSIEAKKSDLFKSGAFCEFVIDEVDVDLISDFTILNPQSDINYYTYPFSKHSIADYWEIEGSRIPLMPIRDWFVLYQMMKGREKRLEDIKKYLINNPNELLNGSPLLYFPKKFQDNISNLLESTVFKYFRCATSNDAKMLTDIAVESEAFWGYDEEYMDKFRREYEVMPEFINNNIVYVLKDEDNIPIAFYGIIKSDDKWELEYLYLKVSYIGKGIGRLLFEHIKYICEKSSISKFSFVTSPQARAFYEKMGAVVTGEIESLVIKGRLIPKLEYIVFEEEFKCKK